MEKVQQALIAQLLASFPTWIEAQIAWENTAFTPPIAKPWLAFHFMPVEEKVATLGPGGNDEANGLVQIDVNYPLGGGESDSRETINTLRTCFKPQLLGYEGQPVTILSRNRSGGLTSNGFYKIPFTVRWRSLLTRST